MLSVILIFFRNEMVHFYAFIFPSLPFFVCINENQQWNICRTLGSVFLDHTQQSNSACLHIFAPEPHRHFSFSTVNSRFRFAIHRYPPFANLFLPHCRISIGLIESLVAFLSICSNNDQRSKLFIIYLCFFILGEWC